MDALRTVDLDTWSDFFMTLRGVLAELPPGTQLILSPADDARTAHIVTLPKPHVDIRTEARPVASIACDSITDVIDTIEENVEEHWGLSMPRQLSYGYDGDASPKLQKAFTDEGFVADLPEGERPSSTAHSSGDDSSGGLAGHLDADVAEKLRQLGSSAID